MTSLTRAIGLCTLLVLVGTVSSCALLELDKVKQSDAFKKFCSWAPVAVKGITEAALEADKDPSKLQVANAMREATGYLRLVAAQCEAAVMMVK